jgi:alpha-mannosidase
MDHLIHVKYSTPSIYIAALKKKQVNWPVRYHDMLPYQESNQDVWSGLFTSRPQLKAYIRRLSSVYHASQQLFALAGINQGTDANLTSDLVAASEEVAGTLAEMQDTKAVTGASTMRVTHDYLRKISESIETIQPLYARVMGETLNQKGFENDPKNWHYCTQTNATWKACPYAKFDKDSDIVLAVHNPSGMEL